MSEIDSEYYEHVKPKSFAEKMLIYARNRIFTDLSKRYWWTEKTRVLDFGVSDTITGGDNILERLYPYPEAITAVGLGSGVDFKTEFPKVVYLRIEPFKRLPFEDQHFDLATSNAVFEHMGSLENQRWMLNELGRVGKNVYVTAPNRYFPIEHHTALPVIHYSNALFRLGCRFTGQDKWAQKENLILTDKTYMHRFAGARAGFEVGYTGIKLGPFSSNLFVKYQNGKERDL